MIAALVLAWSAIAPQADYAPQPVDASELKMPDVDGVEQAEPPANGVIERDGALTDRLTAAGQRVEYSFESAAGELSLFELDVVGYARGWQSAALMEVLAADGEVLARRERRGGESFHLFFAFEAPAAATYRLRLSAPKTYYRYTLVRHSSYRARSSEPRRSLNGHSNLHGFLAHPQDEARFRVRLDVGDEIGLSVLNAQDKVRRAKRLARRGSWEQGGADAMGMGAGMGMGARPGRGRAADAMGGAMQPGRERDGMRGGMTMGAPERAQRGGPNESYPDCVVRVEHDDAVVSASAHFVLFKAPQAGEYTVVVAATSAGEGGLFELIVEEALAKHEVSGFVGDFDGAAAAYVSLRFLREPELDLVGVATSDDEGRYAIELPPGPYTVLLTGPDGQRGRVVRTNLALQRDVHFVFAPEE